MTGAIAPCVHLANAASLIAAVLAGCTPVAHVPPRAPVEPAPRAAITLRVERPVKARTVAPTSHFGFPGAASPASARDCVRTGCNRQAIATIAAFSGHYAKGTVRFREVDNGLEVSAAIDNLPGKHVYSVHVTGDCSSPSAIGAQLDVLGDGRVKAEHAGELGELRDDGKLTSVHSTFLEGASLDALIGHAIVIEWRSDNPFLDAKHRVPARVGCGVVGIAR